MQEKKKTPKKCRAGGCTNNASHFPSRMGYCEKHRRQINRKGYIYKTKFDSNLFIDCDNICQIELFNCKCETAGYAIIDREDKDKCMEYKWCLVYKGKTAYVKSSTLLYLHHLIIGRPPVGMEIDHKNMDGLNNRRSNLRFCTSEQNKRNRNRPSSNTSGYKGVIWDKKAGKWRAQITEKRKLVYIGIYDDPILAAKAYDKEAIARFEAFARPNFL